MVNVTATLCTYSNAVDSSLGFETVLIFITGTLVFYLLVSKSHNIGIRTKT